MIRLCTGLLAGRACPRRVMKPLGLCDRCRPAAPRRLGAPSSAAYQRTRRARLARAGLSPAMEGA